MAKQETQEIMIWPQKKADGVLERLVGGEPRRIGVAVWA
jgi:hypothetical protein